MVIRDGMFEREDTHRPTSRFKKSILAMCIMAAVHSQSHGQETDAGEEDENIVEEEVIVTGIRRNLQNAQELKRNAETFVDAISAQDIGELPDVSVLETLQRLPGITIERFAAPDDSDHFSTEGSNATLRGLPQTRSAFNGRDSFSANSNRGLSFEDVSPELLGSVEVFKNQTADMIEGGISGTINLNTRKPFDTDERTLDVSAQANYGDLAEETTPSFSGLYSDRFNIEAGEVGVLFSYANSDLDFRADGSELGQHNLVEDAAGAGEDRFVPINAGVRSTITEREREGLSAAVQFRNHDSSFESTLEYLRSDSSTDWQEFAFFSDDNGGSLAPGAEFDNTAFVRGRIVGVATGLGPQTRRSQTDELVEDLSLNLKFQVNERLDIEADVQYIEATTDRLDLSVFGGLLDGVEIDVNASSDTPKVTFLAPAGSTQSDAEYFSDPSNYFWRAAMDHTEESEGEELAFRFDVDYQIDAGPFESVEAGVRFAERDQTTRWSTYNWQNLSESWNGGFRDFAGQQFLPNDGNASGPSSPVTSPAVQAFSFSGFHDGNAGGAVNALFPNTALVGSYLGGFIDGLSSFGRAPLSARGGALDGTNYLPAEVNETTEENTAVYVKLNFGGDGEHRYSGNLGLRYVQVDTTVAGGINFPTLPANVIANADPADVAFANGASNTADAESDFSKVLPSLNVKYEVTDDLIARFGYSSAIAFPDLGNLRYNYNITADIQNNSAGDPEVQGYEQISGNPFLEPMEADNFDLSLEWYFGASNSLTAGIFYKDIENFFANNTVDTPVTNNGVTRIVAIDQTINIGEAKLRGFELAYQQFFDQLPQPWNGLGVQFNYTRLSESGVPNQNTRPVESGNSSDVTRTTIPFTNLPLQGLSENSFNLVGIYESERLTARLAYNWREEYLLSIRHVNLGLPVFTDSRGQLDGSIFFRVNDIVELGLQATNLTNEETVTTMQVDQAGTKVTRSSFINDRRFSFVIRGTF